MTTWSTRLATFFGVGWIPFAPGTFASAIAVPLGAAIALAGWPTLTAAAALVTLAGIWACGAHATRAGLLDPSECVLDEVAGQWLALIPAAILHTGFAWRPLAMAFFLFRLFDILKPWPIAALERLPGGFGIMMDDVGAGIVAGVILYAMLAIHLV